jgi:hypothetical protein
MSILSSLPFFPLFKPSSPCEVPKDTALHQKVDPTSPEKIESPKVIALKQTKSIPSYIQFSTEQSNQIEKLEVDNFLSKKFIAHIFGDSFLENSPHEGWFVQDALMHMVHILKENEISSETSQVVKDLEKAFNFYGRYILPLSSLESESHELILNVKKIKEVLKGEITNLEIGGKIIFPGGYRGHSVVYEIKKTSESFYQFVVYNTGSGNQKHWNFYQKEGDYKIDATYVLEEVKLKNIVENEFLDQLMLLNKESCEDFGMRLYENILSLLEGNQKSAPLDPSLYMMAQRAGVCVWKVLCAYLRYNLPLEQYKYLKLKARLDVFEKWHQLGYSLDFHKTTQRILNRFLVNYEFAAFKKDVIPVEFSREELLVLGLLKVQKTFSHYKFLLSKEEIERTEHWFTAFTGQSIEEDNGFAIRKQFGKNGTH